MDVENMLERHRMAPLPIIRTDLTVEQLRMAAAEEG
jgi:hypothetical protein